MTNGEHFQRCNTDHNCVTQCKDFNISNNDSCLKVDFTINKPNTIEIYGKVCYRNRTPVNGAIVLLYKYTQHCGEQAIFCKKTYTDKNGQYKFYLPSLSKGKYFIKVLVCKDNCYDTDNYCRRDDIDTKDCLMEYTDCQRECKCHEHDYHRKRECHEHDYQRECKCHEHDYHRERECHEHDYHDYSCDSHYCNYDCANHKDTNDRHSVCHKTQNNNIFYY